MLSMSLVLIFTIFSTIPSGQTAAHNTALRFGQTAADYIQLPNRIMGNFVTRFSLCTWIRKLSDSSQPIVLQINDIVTLGDDGYYNRVAGTNLDLWQEYNRGIGTWFHVCLIWSGEDRRIRVYLDGRLIGTSGWTDRSVLPGGRRLICLGNWVLPTKRRDNVFGGDLFKLNIYNRVLTETEIKNMSSTMCSRQEDKLASIKVLSWEEIISPEIERSGDVTDIPIRCQENTWLPQMKQLKDSVRQVNKTLLNRLRSAEEEIKKSKNKSNKILEGIGYRLDITDQDLAESKNKSRILEKNSQHLNENLVEVLGRLQKTEQKQG